MIQTQIVKDEDYAQYLAENDKAFRYGSFTDERDGEVYSTVKIGDQVWMAENLRFVSIGGAADDDSGSFAYGEVERNVGKFGRLYTWTAAMNLHSRFSERELSSSDQKKIESGRYQGIAPAGWHIPNNSEWDNLCSFIQKQFESQPGTTLKAKSYWENMLGFGDGTDGVGFAALPSGGRYSMGNFFDLNTHAYFWTSSVKNHEYAHFRSLSCRNGNLASDYGYKTDAYAIRCVKDI